MDLLIVRERVEKAADEALRELHEELLYEGCDSYQAAYSLISGVFRALTPICQDLSREDIEDIARRVRSYVKNGFPEYREDFIERMFGGGECSED